MKFRIIVLLALLLAFTGYGQNVRTTSITNQTTFLSAGAAGLGSTLTVAGASTLAATTHTSSSNSTTMLVSGAVGFGSTLSVAGAFTLGTTIVFTDNVRQTFNPGANAAGLNVGSIAGDPDTPVNGDIWYDSTGNTLDARINGATVSLGAGGGGGSQTPITADVNYDSFKATNLSRLHLSKGALTATPTNLTGVNPSLLMLGHSAFTITPTNTTIVNVVTPTGTDWVLPKYGYIVVTGATAGLVHTFAFSNAMMMNTLTLRPGETNFVELFYDGITNRVFSWNELTTGGGATVLSNAPTINNANLTGSAVAPTQAAGDNDDSIASTAFVNASINASNTTTMILSNGVLVGTSRSINFIIGTNMVARFTNELGQVTAHFSSVPDGVGAGGALIRIQTNTVTVGSVTNQNFIFGPNVFFLATNNATTGSVDVYVYTSQTNFDTVRVTNTLSVVGAANLSAATVTNNISYLTANLTPVTSGTNFQADFTVGARTYTMTNAFWLSTVAQVPGANEWKGWSAILVNNSGGALRVGMDPLFKRSGTNNVSVPNAGRAKIIIEPDGTGGTQLTNFLGQIILFDNP